MEESWRLAYLSSKGGVHDAIADTPREIESVNAAVEAAKERFKGQLTFAPNSESEIEGNPFIRPEKVWEALQWLATTYYKSKMGQLRVTNFDQSVKEACGWWYKGDQGETTMTRYRNSYTTHAHGRTYQLAEHIGKGTNFDAPLYHPHSLQLGRRPAPGHRRLHRPPPADGRKLKPWNTGKGTPKRSSEGRVAQLPAIGKR